MSIYNKNPPPPPLKLKKVLLTAMRFMLYVVPAVTTFLLVRCYLFDCLCATDEFTDFSLTYNASSKPSSSKLQQRYIFERVASFLNGSNKDFASLLSDATSVWHALTLLAYASRAASSLSPVIVTFTVIVTNFSSVKNAVKCVAF